MVMQVCNLSTREAAAGGSGGEASLSYNQV